MWWCIVTVMMVGYGDITPTTIPGKVFASIACVIGVLVVALPVSVLGANFSTKMAAHRYKIKNQQVISNARKQGVSGVIQSRERVKQAFHTYNDATRRCIELGKEMVVECNLNHAKLWRDYLY